jgi:NADH-quinone oxidoreductase subunit M
VFASARAGDAASTALSGALLLTFNHGIIMTMLFSLDARILASGESPDMRFLGGLRNHQRRLAAFLLLSIFASAGLPGLSNFVGEILIYFSAFSVSPWLVLFAGFGTLIGAAALVRYYHAVFLGVPSAENPAVAPDLGAGETAVALGVAALWLVLGLYPMLLLHPVEKALLFLNYVIL